MHRRCLSASLDFLSVFGWLLSDLVAQTIVLFNISETRVTPTLFISSGTMRFVSLTCCYGYAPFYHIRKRVRCNLKILSNDPFFAVSFR